jgi:hypothetical protein
MKFLCILGVLLFLCSSIVILELYLPLSCHFRTHTIINKTQQFTIEM